MLMQFLPAGFAHTCADTLAGIVVQMYSLKGIASTARRTGNPKPIVRIEPQAIRPSYSCSGVAFMLGLVLASRIRRRALSNMPNIGLDRIYDLVDTTGEDQFSHSQTESNHHLRLNMGR